MGRFMAIRYCLITLLFVQNVSLYAGNTLFPEDLPLREWIEFNADGFSEPVSAILFSDTEQTCCCLGLGGLGSGCLDVETTGVFGFSSIFQPAYDIKPTPYWTLRSPKMFAPFLGLSTNGKTWVFANKQFIEGGEMTGCVD